MTKEEHRDVYIAASVGGIGLVLILLWLFTGGNPAQATPLASTTPDLGGVPDGGDYNYNIAPYQSSPPIAYGASSLPANTAPGGGCCDNCGPATGAQYFNTSVAQYETLDQGGA